MKKKNRFIIVKFIMSFLFAACLLIAGYEIFEFIKPAKEDTPTYTEEYTPIYFEYNTDKPVIQIIENKEEPNIEVIKVEVDDSVSLIQKLSEERYYAYSKLDKNEQELYRKMYQMMVDHKGEVETGTLDTTLIDKVFSCILIDNPEFFYVKGYNLISYTNEGELVKYNVSGLYALDDEKITKHQKKVDDIVNNIIKNAPEGDDYQKIKYAYEYIIKNTEYVKDAKGNQTFLSVFEGKKSVCQGYAKAFQYLLTKMGVFCTFVQGTTDKGEPHVWNLVRSNGNYYYVDVTWGDIVYDIKSDENIELLESPEIDYDHLCVTTEEITKDHKIKMPYELPECTKTDDNYYKREKLYFTYVDHDRLEDIFSSRTGYITLKCSDKYVYEEMITFLLDENYAFTYSGQNTLKYICEEDDNKIIFTI